jgi:hypothetical protein
MYIPRLKAPSAISVSRSMTPSRSRKKSTSNVMPQYADVVGDALGIAGLGVSHVCFWDDGTVYGALRSAPHESAVGPKQKAAESQLLVAKRKLSRRVSGRVGITFGSYPSDLLDYRHMSDPLSPVATSSRMSQQAATDPTQYTLTIEDALIRYEHAG